MQAEFGEGLINVFGPPPLEGLGTAGGFKIVIEDRGDTGLKSLQETAEKIIEMGDKTPGLQELFTSFRADTPWLYLDINRTAARTKGVLMSEIFNTLQVYLGSLYVNDFNKFGRTWQVNVQGAAPGSQIEDLTSSKWRMSGQGIPSARSNQRDVARSWLRTTCIHRPPSLPARRQLGQAIDLAGRG